MTVYISKPQTFKGSRWIAIFSNEPNGPTLWISYGDEFTPEERQECERYAEKVAALINEAAAKGEAG